MEEQKNIRIAVNNLLRATIFCSLLFYSQIYRCQNSVELTIFGKPTSLNIDSILFVKHIILYDSEEKHGHLEMDILICNNIFQFWKESFNGRHSITDKDRLRLLKLRQQANSFIVTFTPSEMDIKGDNIKQLIFQYGNCVNEEY
jgi:hypothetical protein